MEFTTAPLLLIYIPLLRSAEYQLLTKATLYVVGLHHDLRYYEVSS